MIFGKVGGKTLEIICQVPGHVWFCDRPHGGELVWSLIGNNKFSIFSQRFIFTGNLFQAV